MLCLPLSIFGQNIDSLIALTKSNTEYQNKFDAFEQLSNYYLNREIDSAKIFINQLLRIGELHKNPKFLTTAYQLKAELSNKSTKYDEAIDFLKKAYQIYHSEKDTFNTSEILKKIGQVYDAIPDASNAIKYYLQSLELKELLQDKKGQASIYNSIGTLYYRENNLKEALNYYQKSLIIVEELQFTYAIGIIKMNIGNIYSDLDSINFKNIDSNLNAFSNAKLVAKEYYLGSLKIAEEMTDYSRIPSILSNLASVDSVNAIPYLEKSYKIRLETGDIKGQWLDLNNIANLYLDKKNYRTAKVYSEKALKISTQNKLLNLKYKSLKQLATIQNKIKDYQSAFINYRYSVVLQDSLEAEETKTAFAELEKKWNYEKREKENELLKQGNELLIKDKQLDDERLAKQRIYLWASAGGFLLFSFLIFFILRGYRQKQKANILLSEQKKAIEVANTELNQQNEEIAAQRDEIESQKNLVTHQRDEIEEIHKEVSQSIDYAKRLQTAILPKPELLRKTIEDFFVLFMPKDKVSGDFYWWTEIDNKTIVTAADCTGHGVPGAFMSMLGVSFLKEIVNKEYVSKPALILKKLRKEIIKTLDQKGIAGEQKDGMDMALITFDKETYKLQFAGANNPLYIISKHDLSDQLVDAKIMDEGTGVVLYELKPDKMPIAIYEKMDPFRNYELQLNKGDRLYLFSDGFADQFGGPSGKKFMYKPFKRLLIDNCDKTMNEQIAILEKAFIEWRADEEQIDDVVVIGLKL